ncbi:NAD-dependent epimerase/dehydratase family protein [Devosia sp.]|uniref:NAD-dependent epimerase/dehydratase family protein n=1 Tax=Devosia sp. TaxID=1871048 RepID=UPI003267007E
MNIFFFGLGFSSLASAQRIRARHPDAVISGTVRAADKAEALIAEGFAAHLFDGTTKNSALLADLAAATHIVLSIAPDAAGDPALNSFGAELGGSKNLQWLGYYSTVGVYGDFGGAWIDENAICQPINVRSQQRVVAEQTWRDFAQANGVPLAVLRLAGIYGPGRSTFDKLREGNSRRVIKKDQVFNRIHVADIARVTALAAERKLAGTFNMADDEPAPPQDVIAYAANMAGLTPPPEQPYETAEMTLMARSFYADNKRVSNAAVKHALGIELLYPTYREGLKAIHDAQ